MSGPDWDHTAQPFTMEFPCISQCNCEGRRILDRINMTTADSHLDTLEDLQNQLDDKVLLKFEKLKSKGGATEVKNVNLLKLNMEERINFLDMLDQVRHASSLNALGIK
ncbi:MAG TPA: hypothetical protein VGO47_04540 [Chlamydiales bacterium]|nr:hypothetical protein [Chlamydiales bacterium]